MIMEDGRRISYHWSETGLEVLLRKVAKYFPKRETEKSSWQFTVTQRMYPASTTQILSFFPYCSFSPPAIPGAIVMQPLLWKLSGRSSRGAEEGCRWNMDRNVLWPAYGIESRERLMNTQKLLQNKSPKGVIVNHQYLITGPFVIWKYYYDHSFHYLIIYKN